MGDVYQCFIPNKLPDLIQDKEIEMNVSNLAPGRYKYEAKIVKCMISSAKDKYPDQLWIRFPKGQMHPEPWTIKVLEEVNKIPPEFR